MNEKKGAFKVGDLRKEIALEWGEAGVHVDLFDHIHERSELMEELFDACMKHCSTQDELFVNISLTCQKIAMLDTMKSRRPTRKQGGTCNAIINHKPDGTQVLCVNRTTKAGRHCAEHKAA